MISVPCHQILRLPLTQTMEQEIIPSHMQILTHHFESTKPLHIRRAKIIAFEHKPGQKESNYMQAFHAQKIDSDLHVASAEENFAQLCISRLHISMRNENSSHAQLQADFGNMP